MLLFFLAAQLAAAPPRATSRHLAPPRGMAQGGNTYATANVHLIVDSAAARNRRIPRALGRYTAELESEIVAGVRRGDGAEATPGLEQVASSLTWDRRGNTEQRVIGYRSQSVEPNFSSLGFFLSTHGRCRHCTATDWR